ncbi:MAG: hypothetical protein KTR20_01075 [Cellvibrionaceae bacterium]|nr:hypothetical protein [Cellvibrionaceae bacterium]
MGNVLEFKRKTPWQKHRGSSLCRDGFHKWRVLANKQFDVKEGKLVTRYRCERCNKEKVELT